MQKREGYRQAFKYYLTIKSMLDLHFITEDLANIVENKNIDLLYEYFCFFKFSSCISKIYDVSIDKINIIKDETTKTIGKENRTYSYFEFRSEDKQFPHIKLFFKKYYRSNVESYSNTFDPDISLEVYRPNESLEHIIIFDAKFKMEVDKGERNKFKNEDINKMHAYKDAINNVLGSFVVYPGDVFNIFHHKKYCKECEINRCKNKFYGVGAFPLKPNVNAEKSIINLLESLLSCEVHQQ